MVIYLYFYQWHRRLSTIKTFLSILLTTSSRSFSSFDSYFISVSSPALFTLTCTTGIWSISSKFDLVIFSPMLIILLKIITSIKNTGTKKDANAPWISLCLCGLRCCRCRNRYDMTIQAKCWVCFFTHIR